VENALLPSVSRIIAVKQIAVSGSIGAGILRDFTADTAASRSSTANGMPLLG
jgi:hypothetical protein